MTIKEVSEQTRLSPDTLRYYEGVGMISARLSLLKEQMEALEEQKQAIQETMNRLAYKIERYEQALVTES